MEEKGRRCLLIAGDVSDENFCRDAVRKTVDELGGLDVLVNNAAEQHPQETIEKITGEQLERTFQTNIFAMFYLIKAAMPYLKEGSAIVNTTSVTAYRGSPTLLDYSATKGAIVAFTRALSTNLAEKKIRVNAVAPVQSGQVAPCFVFLASDDSSYITGQVLHPNGGELVNG